jgi:hypothetical protein
MLFSHSKVKGLPHRISNHKVIVLCLLTGLVRTSIRREGVEMMNRLREYMWGKECDETVWELMMVKEKMGDQEEKHEIQSTKKCP